MVEEALTNAIAMVYTLDTQKKVRFFFQIRDFISKFSRERNSQNTKMSSIRLMKIPKKSLTRMKDDRCPVTDHLVPIRNAMAESCWRIICLTIGRQINISLFIHKSSAIYKNIAVLLPK